MSKIKSKGGDRKKVLAIIRAEEKYVAAEKAVEAAEQAVMAAEQMYEGRDLKNLRELDAIFRELRSSFKGSEGFKIIRQALKARIKDEAKAAQAKIDESTGLDEARRSGLMLVLDNLRATGFDAKQMVEDHLTGKGVRPIEEYKTAEAGEQIRKEARS